MSWALLWALPVKWEWLCSRLRDHYLLSKSRHLTSPQMLTSEKKKWLLHLGNLAQTSKTFPNIISKITQHNQLLAKHKIIDLLMVRVTLNEYTSNFESLDWEKHHVPDAFFRNSFTILLLHFFFFEFLLFLAAETKQECKYCKGKLVHGKTPTFDWEVWNFKI